MHKSIIILASTIIMLLCYSCDIFDKHTIVLNQQQPISETLIPPKSCYHVKINATGKTTCPTKLEIIMGRNVSSINETINLEGEYSNKRIIEQDWYDNSMQLKIVDPMCLQGDFEIFVRFYD